METNPYAPSNAVLSNVAACEGIWNGLAIRVTARLVSRYAFTTASIDAWVDGRKVLGTGGVMKATGGHQESFQVGSQSHRAVLSWSAGSLSSFPFRLQIDETTVLEGRVQTQNWWLSLWPWAVAFALGIFAAYRMY